MSNSRPRAVLQTHLTVETNVEEPTPLLRQILPDVDTDCVVCGQPGRYRVEPRQDGPRMVVDHPGRNGLPGRMFPCRVPRVIDQMSKLTVD